MSKLFWGRNSGYALLWGGMIGIALSTDQLLRLGWSISSAVVMAVSITIALLGAVLVKDALGPGILGGSFISAAILVLDILRGISPLDFARVVLLLSIGIIGLAGYGIMRIERRIRGRRS